MHNNIFSERLRAARVMSGLSLSDLAKKVGSLSKNSIYKYEKGEMMPGSEVLIKISNALSVKVDYFFRSNKISLSGMEYRKKVSKLSKKEQMSIEEKVKDHVERYNELEILTSSSKVFVNPLDNISINTITDIEKAANELRSEWNLGTDPLVSVVDLLEEKGIKMVELDEINSFDGLSAKMNGFYVIAYNKNFDSVRKRLTVLHELAHLVLIFSDDLPKEKLCHSFASAFLMPRDIFIQEFGERRSKLTINELISMKEYFGCSIQAIIYRAYNLGLITESNKNDFFKRWSKMGFRINEPGEYKALETPRKFEQLLQRAVAEEIISFSKAAALKSIGISQIRSDVKVVS